LLKPTNDVSELDVSKLGGKKKKKRRISKAELREGSDLRLSL
jgi:hypothetical protein